MDNEHTVIWVSKTLCWPKFREQVFTGAYNEALEFIKKKAQKSKFLAGQVLSKDGKVLANIAPQGHVRLSSE